MRENAGYQIIASTPVNERDEVVIGKSLKCDDYVCWFYRNDEDSYFWGRYTSTYEGALRVYIDRLNKEFFYNEE